MYNKDMKWYINEYPTRDIILGSLFGTLAGIITFVDGGNVIESIISGTISGTFLGGVFIVMGAIEEKNV